MSTNSALVQLDETQIADILLQKTRIASLLPVVDHLTLLAFASLVFTGYQGKTFLATLS